ncbi:MAG: hypothetical protein ABUK01_08330 [Leptospirales bacterium]
MRDVLVGDIDMIQEDYIMRLVNKLHLVFAKILNLTEEKNYDEAEEVIKVILKSLSGLNIQIITSFDLPVLLRMMDGYDANITKDKDKLIETSKLIFEQSKIELTRGNSQASTAFAFKALLLQIHALKMGKLPISKSEQVMLKKQIKASDQSNLPESVLNDIEILFAAQ